MRCSPCFCARVAVLLGITVFGSVLTARSAEAKQSMMRLGIFGHEGTLALDSASVAVQIGAPMGETFSAVSKVFSDLKIPVDMRDSTRGIIGASNVPLMRRFAEQRMSQSFNCGRSMTGLNADSWRVYVTTFAFLEPINEGNTTLRLALVGGAQDIAGNSTGPVACATTGKTEQAIAERVRKELERPTSP